MKKLSTKIISALMFAVIFLANTVNAAAQSDKVDLRTPDSSGNTAFLVENMFPGDMETKDFSVKVSHKKPIILYYHADIRPGYEKLAEVMKIKVYLTDKDVLLYDGLMRDMPNSLSYKLAAKEKKLVYRISVYLETSVGNEYQNKQLVSDFRWWYTEEEDDDSGSGGGTSGGGTAVGGLIGGGTFLQTDTTEYDYVKIAAEVILDGQYPRGNEFYFSLKNEKGNIIQTVRNKDGLVEFSTLKFSREGVYVYYITQHETNINEIEFDKAVYKVIVDVKKQDNAYVATVSYEKDGIRYLTLPRFSNTTKDYKSPEDVKQPDGTQTEPPSENGDADPDGKPDTGIVPGADTSSIDTPSNPKTGDAFNMELYLSVFGISLIFIILLLICVLRKRRG